MQPMSTAPEKVKRRTQAERRDATREKILNAAVELLRSKGYASFRVSDVADSAQVSRGSQTHHFPTKSSLLLAVLERVYEESTASGMSCIQMLRPTEDPLDLLFAEAEDFFLGPNFAIALDLLNMGDSDPELRETVKELSRIHRLPLEQRWIEALIGFGVDPERARSVVWMSYTIYRGLAMRALIQKDPEHNAQVISEWRTIAHQQIALAKK
ncbi:TetR/AcrR family transcriptional regulator [Pseudomonas aeruginosa]|jgi:AcrR family transcriptional regulator|nr:TetR/AcrR family transcriptional regulator [Pseudomonas aeruginosa]